MLKTLRYGVEYILIRCVVAFLHLLPMPVSARIAKGLGNIAYFFFGRRKAIALQGLDLAFGSTKTEKEKKRILRRSFQNMMLSVIEFFLVDKLARNPWPHFTMTGVEHLNRALEKKKGVVLAISHLGSWEYLEFLTSLVPVPSSVIVKSIRNPFLNQWIVKLRTLTGVNAIHKDEALRSVVRELKKKDLVAILIDQWAGPEGIWIPFFGKETSTTSMPARFAGKFKSALIPGFCVRRGLWEYEIILKPEVPVNGDSYEEEFAVTKLLNEGLEDMIRSFPDQWTWVHRRWKDKPKGIRSKDKG